MDEAMRVGGGLFAEDTQIDLAVAAGDITKNLIVGAVFLDDVDHVLDLTGLADPFRDRAGGLVFPGGKQRLGDRVRAEVAGDLF